MSLNKLYLTSFIASVIIFPLFLVFVSLNSATAAVEYATEEYEEGEETGLSSDEYEKSAHGTLVSDKITTGLMDEFSRRMIVVDGVKYSLCKDVMVYNNAGVLILLKDIEAALEVKLFRNSGCVRKINVLSFAH